MWVRVFVWVLLTFKEDEPAVMPLVSSINVSGQAPPEVTDGHGIVIQNPVPTHPPEPTALRKQNNNVFLCVKIYRQLKQPEKQCFKSVSWLSSKLAHVSKVNQTPNKVKRFIFKWFSKYVPGSMHMQDRRAVQIHVAVLRKLFTLYQSSDCNYLSYGVDSTVFVAVR